MNITATIKDSLLVLQEIPRSDIKTIVNSVFRDSETQARWPAGGSPFQKWYRQNASISTTICDRKKRRLIAWKTNTAFVPENIFFRTVDTSRLLPMALAEFRVQIWADPSLWEHLDKQLEGDTRVEWYTHTVAFMVSMFTLFSSTCRWRPHKTI